MSSSKKRKAVDGTAAGADAATIGVVIAGAATQTTAGAKVLVVAGGSVAKIVAVGLASALRLLGWASATACTTCSRRRRRRRERHGPEDPQPWITCRCARCRTYRRQPEALFLSPLPYCKKRTNDASFFASFFFRRFPTPQPELRGETRRAESGSCVFSEWKRTLVLVPTHHTTSLQPDTYAFHGCVTWS